MSKKIVFPIRVSSLDQSKNKFFNGASARNLLQFLLGPDFCLIAQSDDGDSVEEYRSVLFDRKTLHTHTNGVLVGDSLPRSIDCDLAHCEEHGLHIHNSVINRLEETIKFWFDAYDLFRDEYGIVTKVNIPENILEFRSFLNANQTADSPYCAIVHWG
ncbi:MAG: hypothetical protein ACK4LR_09515 [Acidovorax temperans]|uniref:hypothetical protein n=1 Tax=Acidovorax temperans TaxID=80878 RepID=UPI00391C4B3E